MPQQLPPNTYVSQPWRDAYAKCLHYEQIGTIVSNDVRALIRARILGYLIREAPSDEGRDVLAREINSCDDDGKFERLATLYINHFTRYFRAAKCRTQTPSTHPSRPSFDDTQETLKYLLEEAPQDHATAKRKALIRDGYRCMLTGAYDIYSVDLKPSIRPDNVPSVVAHTQAAHILPGSTNFGISDSDQVPKAATMWDVLAHFGNTLAFDELHGAGIHRLENVMTLRLDEHVSFDSLELWLESTNTPHTYTPCSTMPMYRESIPATVTFTTSDPEKLPLPSPDYLRLHAAAARVAHLSGVGEYIEKVLRDLEEMSVLSNDGSSALVLAAALEGISVH